MSDELDLVPCRVLDETPKAFKLQERDGDQRTEWFPKSYVSFKRRNVKTLEAVAEIPLWLLKKKGWE